MYIKHIQYFINMANEVCLQIWLEPKIYNKLRETKGTKITWKDLMVREILHQNISKTIGDKSE